MAPELFALSAFQSNSIYCMLTLRSSFVLMVFVFNGALQLLVSLVLT